MGAQRGFHFYEKFFLSKRLLIYFLKYVVVVIVVVTVVVVCDTGFFCFFPGDLKMPHIN